MSSNIIVRSLKFLNCSMNPFNIILFATNRCCAKCKMCGFWKQKSVDIPPDVLEENLLKCKSIEGSTISLTGGSL